MSRHQANAETTARMAAAAGKKPKPKPKVTRRQLGARVVGVLLLLAGGYTVIDYQVTITCQTEAIDAVQRNIIARSQVTADERDADRNLIDALNTRTTEAGKSEARKAWLAETDRLTQERKARPYPEPRRCR